MIIQQNQKIQSWSGPQTILPFHKIIIFTKFYNNSVKNVNFLLMSYFRHKSECINSIYPPNASNIDAMLIFFILICRQLFCGWFRINLTSKSITLHHYVLPSFWHVCYCLVDQFFGATRNCSWKNDTTGYCFSGLSQYF